MKITTRRDALFAQLQTVTRAASTRSAVQALSGVQLLCLGLLGEYIGRIYTATQARPPFLIAFDTDDEAARAEQPVELASHR